MTQNGVHGNSFEYSDVSVSVKRIPIWGGYIQLYPSGAYCTKEELEAAAVDGKVPAGTPVKVDKIGGTVEFNSETPTGFLYQGVAPGENGGTVDIVTKGELYLTRCKATITDVQKSFVAGRITFIEEE